jgi:hypothetical protein
VQTRGYRQESFSSSRLTITGYKRKIRIEQCIQQALLPQVQRF